MRGLIGSGGGVGIGRSESIICVLLSISGNGMEEIPGKVVSRAILRGSKTDMSSIKGLALDRGVCLLLLRMSVGLFKSNWRFSGNGLVIDGPRVLLGVPVVC